MQQALPMALALLTAGATALAQDPSFGLVANDRSAKPMGQLARPGYLETVVDPNFGTAIRRISDGAPGDVTKPMYSTIQPWNADESLMIVFEKRGGQGGRHRLLDGRTYAFIRYLDDVYPADIEQLFWDYDEPDILYYVAKLTDDFIRYDVRTRDKTALFNLGEVSGCAERQGGPGYVRLGNDVQMPSLDNDVVAFRCDYVQEAYYHRISTGETVAFALDEYDRIAPQAARSGERFYHPGKVLDAGGEIARTLNEQKVEHSSLGQLSTGEDANFAIAFAEGPEGGCLGTVVAHNLETGDCFSVVGQDQGYPYSLAGTHLSAVAHAADPGWLSVSMIGAHEDGQTLLDQELLLVRADPTGSQVYRIGHHRADEDEFDYWGEPHAAISPTATRVLFGSDWSGAEDGQSVEAYVVELPAYTAQSSAVDGAGRSGVALVATPNPATSRLEVSFDVALASGARVSLVSVDGRTVAEEYSRDGGAVAFDVTGIAAGVYVATLTEAAAALGRTRVVIR